MTQPTGDGSGRSRCRSWQAPQTIDVQGRQRSPSAIDRSLYSPCIVSEPWTSDAERRTRLRNNRHPGAAAVCSRSPTLSGHPPRKHRLPTPHDRRAASPQRDVSLTSHWRSCNRKCRNGRARFAVFPAKTRSCGDLNQLKNSCADNGNRHSTIRDCHSSAVPGVPAPAVLAGMQHCLGPIVEFRR